MKFLKSILVITTMIFFSWQICLAYGKQVGDFGVNPDKSKLELRTEIIETKYCNISSIRLSLKLIHKNVSSENIILTKYFSEIAAYRIFKNMKNFKAGKKPEIEVFRRFSSSGLESEQKEIEDSPPDDIFVILKPGDEYVLPFEKIAIASLEDGTEDCEEERCLEPGKYILQVKVVNGFSSFELGKRMREKWKGYGELFFDNTFSEPMEFEVIPEDKRKVVSCNVSS